MSNEQHITTTTGTAQEPTVCEQYREMAREGRLALATVKGVVSQALDGDSLEVAEALVRIEEVVDAALEQVRPTTVRGGCYG